VKEKRMKNLQKLLTKEAADDLLAQNIDKSRDARVRKAISANRKGAHMDRNMDWNYGEKDD